MLLGNQRGEANSNHAMLLWFANAHHFACLFHFAITKLILISLTFQNPDLWHLFKHTNLVIMGSPKEFSGRS
jgi:hypothetical protein